MYPPTRRYATALAISAALLVAGCSSNGDKATTTAATAGEEVFLQPVAATGPDPFTESTAKAAESPPPVTRTQQPQPNSPAPSATQQGIRSIPGGTPGLYGGTQNVASCDVDAQIRFLSANQAKSRAFAQTVGIGQDAVPGYLRGLTPVHLRGDTRVTNHGFRDGRATAYQSVLQSGTAVLVDSRGMPRVRCACGNPLTSPAALKGNPTHRGKAWSGYRPTQVVVVTPAPVVINNITIINITNNTWIERPIGHRKGKDKVVPPPKPRPRPTPTSPSPSKSSESPSPSPSCPTLPPDDVDDPDLTVPPGCPTPTPTSSSPTPTESCPTEPLPDDPDGREPTLPSDCPSKPTDDPTDEPTDEPTDDPTDDPTMDEPTEEAPPTDEDRTGVPDDPTEEGVPDDPTDEVVPDEPTDEIVPDDPTEEVVPDQPTDDVVPDRPTEESVPDGTLPSPTPPGAFNG